MSAAAIIVMIIAIVILWGGLVVATLFLARNPLPDVDGDEGYRSRARTDP